MGRLDAHQFWNTIEVGNVSGSQGAAGDQVIEGPADVDYHLTGRGVLKTVTGQPGHQNVHHALGCQGEGTAGNDSNAPLLEGLSVSGEGPVVPM